MTTAPFSKTPRSCALLSSWRHDGQDRPDKQTTKFTTPPCSSPSFNNSRYGSIHHVHRGTVLDNRSNHEWDLGLCNSIPPSPTLLPPCRAIRLISIFFSPSEGLFHNSFFDQCLLLLFCDRKDRQGNRNNSASRDLFTWKYLLSPAARSLLSTAYM